MNKYRIIKQTDANLRDLFRIESQGESGVWVLITIRQSFEMAKNVIECIKGEEIIASEVVYEC